VGLFEEDIKKVQRLGAINQDNDSTPRLVLVQLGSRHKKLDYGITVQNKANRS